MRRSWPHGREKRRTLKVGWHERIDVACRPPSGKIEYPINPNAWAIKVEQMNRVAPRRIFLRTELTRAPMTGDQAARELQCVLDVVAAAEAAQYPLGHADALRLIEAHGPQHADAVRLQLRQPYRANAGAMSASTTHWGSGASSSRPTYMDTCDHVDCVRRLTTSAKRVLPALRSTSPRCSTAPSACRSALVSVENRPRGLAR
jgi:hypothetical protein